MFSSLQPLTEQLLSLQTTPLQTPWHDPKDFLFETIRSKKKISMKHSNYVCIMPNKDYCYFLSISVFQINKWISTQPTPKWRDTTKMKNCVSCWEVTHFTGALFHLSASLQHEAFITSRHNESNQETEGLHLCTVTFITPWFGSWIKSRQVPLWTGQAPLDISDRGWSCSGWFIDKD